MFSIGKKVPVVDETKFVPIEGDAGYYFKDREKGLESLRETDEEDITKLLLGRVVKKMDDEHLLLDDGTVIKAIGHEGGCSCGAGDYDLEKLNGTPGIITRVEHDYHPAGDGDYNDVPEGVTPHPDNPTDRYTGFYRIFVYCENIQINLMQVNGSDGNGYYGTGFELLVRRVKEKS